MKRNTASPLAVILLSVAMPIWSQAPDETAAIRQTAPGYIDQSIFDAARKGDLAALKTILQANPELAGARFGARVRRLLA